MNKFLFFFLFLSIISCNNDNNDDEITDNTENNSTIVKPKGLFTSSFGNEAALDHNEVNGGLIRVSWSTIEPSQGVYDFSEIEAFLAPIKSRHLKWSLAVIAGSDSPDWLVNTVGADTFEIIWRGTITKHIPKIWDSKVQDRLALLAEALANTYGDDDDLALVYVPQMTSNGIEGHFNGVPFTDLADAGLTATNWVDAVKETAKAFANAFSKKAIAIEVHDIIGESEIPMKIITDLWHDESLNQRVGAAMWWISGKTSYQPDLVTALTNFPGDIYAQAIGRSDQTDRFEDNNYKTVLEQAKAIGIRYIELWEYEFINNTYPEEFKDFNNFSDTAFE